MHLKYQKCLLEVNADESLKIRKKESKICRDCFWFLFKTTVMRPKQHYSRPRYCLQISTSVSGNSHLLSQAIKGNSKQRCTFSILPFLKSFHRSDIRLILQLSCIQKVAPIEICVKNKQTNRKNPPTFAVKKNIWQLCMAVLSISIQHVCFLWMWASQVSPVTLVCSFLESSSPFTNQDQKKSWIMTSQKLWLHMLTMYMALPIQKANTKPQCEQQGFSEFVNFFFF